MDYTLALEPANAACSQKCPAGTISNSQGQCSSDITIGNCSLLSYHNKCLLCAGGLAVSSSGQCVSSCGVGWTSDSLQCVRCPSGCSACDLTGSCTEWSIITQPTCGPTCVLCEAAHTSNCLQCSAGLFLDLETGTCASECRGATFPDPTSHQCLPCKPGCQSCLDFNTCQKCAQIIN